MLDKRTPTILRAWSQVWVEEPGRPTITTELDASQTDAITKLAFRAIRSWNRELVWPAAAARHARLHGPRRAGPRAARRAVRRSATMRLASPCRSMSCQTAQAGPTARSRSIAGRSTICRSHSRTSAIRSHAARRGSRCGTTCSNARFRRPRSWIWRCRPCRARPMSNSRRGSLGYLRAAWWRFLRPAEREARACGARNTLADRPRHGQDGRARSRRGSARYATWRWARIRSRWLQRVWEKKEDVPGSAAGRSGLRGTRTGSRRYARCRAGATSWQTQLARIENPDRKARFAVCRSRRCRPIPLSANAGSSASRCQPIGGASRGCSKGWAICITRFVPRAPQIRDTEPGDAAGNPADRRYFLSDAVDERHAVGPQLARRWPRW